MVAEEEEEIMHPVSSYTDGGGEDHKAACMQNANPNYYEYNKIRPYIVTTFFYNLANIIMIL